MPNSPKPDYVPRFLQANQATGSRADDDAHALASQRADALHGGLRQQAALQLPGDARAVPRRGGAGIRGFAGYSTDFFLPEPTLGTACLPSGAAIRLLEPAMAARAGVEPVGQRGSSPGCARWMTTST